MILVGGKKQIDMGKKFDIWIFSVTLVLWTPSFFTFLSRLFWSEIVCEIDRDLSFGDVELGNGVCCQPEWLLRTLLGFDSSGSYPDACSIIRYLKKPFCHKEIFIFRILCFFLRDETFTRQHFLARKYCFFSIVLTTCFLKINHVQYCNPRHVSERNPSIKIIHLENHKENLKMLRQAMWKPQGLHFFFSKFVSLLFATKKSAVFWIG